MPLLLALPPLFGLLIWLLVVLIIAALICWVIRQLGLPPPIVNVATVILVVVVVILLVYLLLGLVGMTGGSGLRC